MRVRLNLLTGTLCALVLFACSDDSSSTNTATDSTESDSGDGDGDTGDGDGDTGDGDGDTGDGDGDGDGDTGDGDGDTGDGDGDGDAGDGDGDGDTGDGDGDTGDGDGDTGDGDGDTGDGDGDGDTGDPIACDEIEMQYEMLATTSNECQSDDQCHVVDGHCWMGLGGCWYVVNETLKQTDLDALAQQYQGQNCFGPICLCIAPPESVGCVDGICQEI